MVWNPVILWGAPARGGGLGNESFDRPTGAVERRPPPSSIPAVVQVIPCVVHGLCSSAAQPVRYVTVTSRMVEMGFSYMWKQLRKRCETVWGGLSAGLRRVLLTSVVHPVGHALCYESTLQVRGRPNPCENLEKGDGTGDYRKHLGSEARGDWSLHSWKPPRHPAHLNRASRCDSLASGSRRAAN